MVAAIASTIVYVVGTVLYGVLTGLVVRRRQKTWSEIILMLLGLSAAVWYFGNALDRAANLLFTERPTGVIELDHAHGRDGRVDQEVAVQSDAHLCAPGRGHHEAAAAWRAGDLELEGLRLAIDVESQSVR